MRVKASRARHDIGRDVVGKVGRIDQLHAGRDEQAAGAADDEQALDAACFHAAFDGSAAVQELVVQVGGGPAWIEGRDDGVRAAYAGRHAASVERIGNDGRYACRQDFGRIAHQGGDGMAALQQFGQDGSADKSGGANQGNVHGASLSVEVKR
jgi:hypothetical protein